MNSNFIYTGKVTLKSVLDNKVISTQHFNSGTVDLFKAYAMSMAGMDISSLLPSYLKINSVVDKVEYSLIRSTNGVSVVRNYVIEDEKPLTRITVTLTKNMFNIQETPTQLVIKLLTSPQGVKGDQVTLANVTLNSDDAVPFLEVINSTPSGTQIIVIWDLYIQDKSDT